MNCNKQTDDIQLLIPVVNINQFIIVPNKRIQNSSLFGRVIFELQLKNYHHQKIGFKIKNEFNIRSSKVQTCVVLKLID